MRTRLLVAAGLLLSIGSSLSAGDEKGENSLAGTWQGVIAIGGKEIPVVFEISSDGRNGWKGHLLSPSQTDQKIPLSLIDYHDRDLNLAAEIIGHVREHLAGYKAPKSVDFPGALPRYPTGKLYKRLLRDPYWEGAGRSI